MAWVGGGVVVDAAVGAGGVAWDGAGGLGGEAGRVGGVGKGVGGGGEVGGEVGVGGRVGRVPGEVELASGGEDGAREDRRQVRGWSRVGWG